MIPKILERIFGFLHFEGVNLSTYRGTRIMGAHVFKASTLRGKVLLQDKDHEHWGISYRLIKQLNSTRLVVQEQEGGMRMHLVLRGTVRLEQHDGSVVELQANQYCFSNRNVYKLYARKNVKTVVLVLHIDRLRAGLSDNGSLLLDNTIHTLSKPMQEEVDMILHHNFNDRIVDEFYSLSVRDIFFRHLNTQSGRMSGMREQAYVSFVMEAEEILRNDLDKSVNVKKIGSQCGTNDFTLQREHTIMYQTSLAYHRLLLRLRYARIQLATTKKSITEIAYEAGYRTLAGFSKMFFDEFKCSPTDWRANHQKQTT